MGKRIKHAGTIRNRLSPIFQLKLVGESLLVGIIGGGVVTLYRFSLSKAESFLRAVTSAAASNIFMVAGWFAFLGVLCFFVCKLMLWEPNTQGSGIPQTDAEVMGRLDMPWHRVLGAKFIEGTLLAIGGLSLGREGPSVQLGAVSGKAVSKGLRSNRGEERLLMTCGAAAGMSAAFGAPLTGVLFAIEEVHKEFTAPLILSVMTSSVMADYFVTYVLGVEPVLQLEYLRDLPHSQYPYLVVLGVLCGLAGAVHNKGMFWCQERLYGRIKKYVPYARLAIPFVIAGVAAFCFPNLMCGGDAIVKILEADQTLPLAFVVVLLVGKYLFTTLCFGSGAPGGTLFPLVVMGMLVGEAYGIGAINAGHVSSDLMVNFLVLGVAGTFAAVVQAPVTGVVLAFELTGTLDALLAVSLVSIVSFTVVKVADVEPFYEHLLGNLLGVSNQGVNKEGFSGEKVLHTHSVGVGAKVEGLKIRDIQWPACVRVITVTRAGVEIVPTGDTELLALDDVLLFMDVAYEFESQNWAVQNFRGSPASGTGKGGTGKGIAT